MKIRPFTETERRYSYTQSMQLQGQTGSIGYLRGDFDKSGYGFFTSWFDHRKHLKTDEFKAEIDEVINALRSEENGLLKDRPSMTKYAGQYPDSSFDGNFGTESGFRVDTEKYAYLIRCNPTPGDYNFYCYCYISEWLDKHMKNAECGIRFIDPEYKELFRIPDGGKIVITSEWGEKTEHLCRYIDEYHAEIGNNLYHICEFAERIQKNGASCEPKQMDKAPKENDMEQTLEINTFFGSTKQVQVTINTYQDNKSLYVGLTTSEEGYSEPYGNLTVNLSVEAPKYCAFVDTNNMPGAEDFLVKNKIAVFTGLTQSSGFCTYPLYLFNPERLEELCPDGMADYERENGLNRKPQEKEKSR